MADNSILIPGYQDETQLPNNSSTYEQYLLKDNFLSEYETEGEKSIVRENLNVPSKDSIYSKQDANVYIAQKIYESEYNLGGMTFNDKVIHISNASEFS